MVVRVAEELAILEGLSSGLVHDTKHVMDLFIKLPPCPQFPQAECSLMQQLHEWSI